MNKYCTNCGNKLPENPGMCVKCGKMVEEVNTKNTDNNARRLGESLLILYSLLLILF